MYLFGAFQDKSHFAISSMAIDIISPVSLVLVTLSHLVSWEFNLPAIYLFFWIISENDQEKPPLQSGSPYAPLLGPGERRTPPQLP